MAKRKTDEEYVMLTTVRLERETDRLLKLMKELDISQSTFILLEIVGDEDNPTKTERRWYDRVKDFVEYVSRNWGPLVFVLDKFCRM